MSEEIQIMMQVTALLFSYLDYDINVMVKCMETYSDTFSSPDLKPLSKLNLTVHLKSGGRISQKLYLKNIGKHVIWLHFQTLQMS